MGFFFLFMILVPIGGILLVVLLIIWAITGDKFWGKLLLTFFGMGAGGVGLLIFLNWFFQKTVLTKNDYRGSYIVNRTYFPGRQANWQYNHFRFQVRDNDSLYFYQTEGARIVATYRGHISSTDGPYHASARLIVAMDSPAHHIVSGNPTTYRSAWSFYLVFHSPLFGNVYFKKGKWKPL